MDPFVIMALAATLGTIAEFSRRGGSIRSLAARGTDSDNLMSSVKITVLIEAICLAVDFLKEIV